MANDPASTEETNAAEAATTPETEAPVENENVETIAEEDWGDAMAEQAATNGGAEAGSADADWGDAMAEQAATEGGAEPAAIQAENVEKAQVFNEFSPNNQLEGKENDIDFILDIPVQMTVELGRTKIAIKNLLQLAQGSVVELEGMAGEPMDVLVNGCLIAQGEVVVVNDKFGIRLTDIITPAERIRKINH